MIIFGHGHDQDENKNNMTKNGMIEDLKDIFFRKEIL